MKRKFYLLVLALFMLFISSCASSKNNSMDIDALPGFVLNPPMATDMIYGVGYGKKNTPTMSLKVAETNARLDIANQIETSIQASMTDYAQEAGADNNSQTIELIESVTKQITDRTLNGATPKERVAMKDGGWWVLMEYNKAQLTKSFDNASKEFERSNSAAFAEFKAAEALRRLKAELDNNPTISNPVE